MTLTPRLISGIARDAGCASMRAAGRTVWNEEDVAVACRESIRLWAILDKLEHVESGTMLL